MASKEHPQSRGQAKKVAAKAAAISVRKKSNNARRLGKPRVKTMTLAQWLAVPDNPVQRDTERHWRKAKAYLSKLCEAHYTVHMAVTEDGKQFKLDSHTRCYGWANKLTDAVPDSLTVIVHYVKDEEAAIDEYYTFDSTGQVKDAADQLFSAFEQFNIEYKSTFFRGCKGIVAAMKEAIWEVGKVYEIEGAPANLRRVSVAMCVEFFQDQLRALESIDPTYSRFSGPPTAAFLLAHYKYTARGKSVEDVVEFFRRHQADAGVKNGKLHDAVYEMTKIMAKKGGGGANQRLDRLSRILACVERFIGPNGRKANFQNGGQVDMENYLIDEHAMLAKKNKKRNDITR